MRPETSPPEPARPQRRTSTQEAVSWACQWVVGYRPESGKDSYSNFKLTEAYDALLFVRQTTAATPLR